MLLAPIALVVELCRGVWRAWGVVARGLDRGMAGVMWPFERAADGMAALLRTLGRVLRISTILAAISSTFQRVLNPIERILRVVGLRISGAIVRIWWFVRDTLAPVARPVGRAARGVGRSAARLFGTIRRVSRYTLQRAAQGLVLVRRAVAHVRMTLRRRRR